MKKLYLILLFFSSLSASGQIRLNQFTKVSMLTDPNKLTPLSWNQAEKEIVDTARFTVVYEIQTVTGSAVMVLEIGRQWKKFYSPRLQLSDDIAIKIKKKMIAGATFAEYKEDEYTAEERAVDSMAGAKKINSEIWIDLSTMKLTERSHDYQRYNVSQAYDEPAPQLEWRMLPESEMVGDYPCMTATTTFRGREWKVWFTPELPINFGPWKLDGLPGLILKMQESRGDFSGICRTITQEPSPMVYYHVTTRKINRADWLKYKIRLHQSPLSVLGNDGKHLILMKGKQITEQDEWTIPYKPIELE